MSTARDSFDDFAAGACTCAQSTKQGLITALPQHMTLPGNVVVAVICVTIPSLFMNDELLLDFLALWVLVALFVATRFAASLDVDK
jgi:hypothetical protein